MRLTRTIILSAAGACITLLAVSFALSQESASAPAAVPAAPSAAVTDDLQWVWGEVVSLDALSKNFKIKFLDYETDTEKEMTITVDDKTTYENVKDFQEIKPQDTVSVDYLIGAEGKNLAKNINVEKPEDAQSITEEQAPAADETASPATEEAPASGTNQAPATGDSGQAPPAAGTQQ
ncbi:MAG TPA: hypothetical protein VMD52_04880 [Patescibacteria group bacterium]|nr:hypothetical protein [Patescibacteria group bacterium]